MKISDPPPVLVITAPGPYQAALPYATRTRETLGVLVQLFAEAERQIVIAAPYIQSQAIFEISILAEALRGALLRGVLVDIMSTRANLESSILQEIAKANPQKVRRFYPSFPTANLSELGSHAKFCIRDGKSAYVGSANLTAPGLGSSSSNPSSKQNFEMGVLIGGQTAKQMQSFWEYTVRLGIFIEL